MEIHEYLIDAAAQLILSGLGDLPVDDRAEWHGYNAEDTELLRDLIEELTWGDLLLAVRPAAKRLERQASKA